MAARVHSQPRPGVFAQRELPYQRQRHDRREVATLGTLKSLQEDADLPTGTTGSLRGQELELLDLELKNDDLVDHQSFQRRGRLAL